MAGWHNVSSKLPWVIKYRPRTLRDYLDQDEAKEALLKWIKNFANEKKKAVLLYGPPGVGKTTLVECLARDMGFELIEMNASDFRRGRDIDRIALKASDKLSLVGRGKMILLDEVDGIYERVDSGAIETILELIKNTRYPVIMTANDPWAPQLRSLRDNVLMIELKRLGKRVVIDLMKRICSNEKIECSDDALDFIYELSQGDLRSAINDLQSVAEGFGKVDLDLAKNLLRRRDRELDPFETLRSIFRAKYAWQARSAVTQTNLDRDMLIEWLNENLPNQIQDPEDLWRAYESLSKATVYLSRIIRSGDWDLLSYALDLMGPGVAFSIKNNEKDRWRWVKYDFPERIRELSRTKESREILNSIASLIASREHVSRARAKTEIIPYLRVIFRNNPDHAAKLVLGLGLTDSMVKFLAGDKSSEILRKVKEIQKKISESVEGEKKVEKTEEPRKEKAEKKPSTTQPSGLDRWWKK
ncbi:MAG: replication factor C large subunit [Sulfolobales archaeon]